MHKGPKLLVRLSESGRAPRPSQYAVRLRRTALRHSSPHATTPAMSRLAEKWLDVDSSSTAETCSKAVGSFCFLGATRSHFYPSL